MTNYLAEFIGTLKEFHKFTGPRIRNSIQTLTKKRKKELNNICQFCKEEKELEAAHVTGNGRKMIIEKILNKYPCASKDNLIKIGLQNVE